MLSNTHDLMHNKHDERNDSFEELKLKTLGTLGTLFALRKQTDKNLIISDSSNSLPLHAVP